MKKFMKMAGVALLAGMLLLTGCGGGTGTAPAEPAAPGEQAEEATYSLNVGMVVSENDPMFAGAMKLKEGVEERTNGRLTIEVYPSSQLGDTADLQEQARVGANVAVITDSARLAEYVSEIGILGAPYIADNYEEARQIVLSDIFKGWETELENYDYKVLSFNWYQGARHFLTNKRVETPDDLRGLRIRTPGSPVWQTSIRAMGATPTDLPWGEVYPGIQQGVIDGAEAQHPATYGASLYEAVDYITKTGHFQLLTGLVVGTQWFDTLPEDIQVILLEEAVKAGDYASQLTLDGLAEYEENMKAEGVEIIEIDITPFKEATESVYEELGYADLRAEINSILGR